MFNQPLELNNNLEVVVSNNDLNSEENKTEDETKDDKENQEEQTISNNTIKLDEDDDLIEVLSDIDKDNLTLSDFEDNSTLMSPTKSLKYNWYVSDGGKSFNAKYNRNSACSHSLDGNT